MQIVASSFDMVAGHGAAKSYTVLALQTISRHFRSLRDAISEQIQVTGRSLGEQETSSNGQASIPRLRFVDHQSRQQRALQQLGVMRHAWRPQRGLPESSVSILRAWLFEHFLHPYVPRLLLSLLNLFNYQEHRSTCSQSPLTSFFFFNPPGTRMIQRKSC